MLDGTKFIAAAAHYADGIDPWHILETGGSDISSAIPMGSVLTLPATGSESNKGAVISRKTTGDKQAFMNEHVQPVFAILDPVYTYTLPARQVANGVVDAFVHTVEQYVTYPVNAKIQDRFAEGILLTLIEEGPKALKEPENYDVRANVMWAATRGAERPDRRRRAARLGYPHARPRADGDARPGSRPDAGGGSACAVERKT